MRPDLKWFVPDFWSELFARGLPGEWPEDLDLYQAPELVRRLARSSMWLEQEPIAIDPRTPSALADME